MRIRVVAVGHEGNAVLSVSAPYRDMLPSDCILGSKLRFLGYLEALSLGVTGKVYGSDQVYSVL